MCAAAASRSRVPQVKARTQYSTIGVKSTNSARTPAKMPPSFFPTTPTAANVVKHDMPAVSLRR